jgi:hypothetical protein
MPIRPSRAAFVLVLGVAFSLLAAAPSRAASEPKAKQPARTALPTSLRGALAADKPVLAPTPAKRPVLAPPAGLIVRQPGPLLASPTATPLASTKPDPGQCRAACAHAYYFCLSAPGSTDCGASWSQCLGDCSHPPLSIGR